MLGRCKRFIGDAEVRRHPSHLDSAPRAEDVGIEIPQKVPSCPGTRRRPSWVLVSDHNVDEWPNAGLTPVPGRQDVWSCGFIPPRPLRAPPRARRAGAEFRRPTKRERGKVAPVDMRKSLI